MVILSYTIKEVLQVYIILNSNYTYIHWKLETQLKTRATQANLTANLPDTDCRNLFPGRSNSVHKIFYQLHKQPQLITPAVDQQTGLDNLLRSIPTLVFPLPVHPAIVLVHSIVTSLKVDTTLTA